MALGIISRRRKMMDYNILYPIGWDMSDLPAENFAIKDHVHPAIVAERGIARLRQQPQVLGFSFDQSREVNMTDPPYYKQIRWTFLQMFKRGLAYKKGISVNWCTLCKCVPANEEVVNGACECCGSEVVYEVESQQILKITEYAQYLVDDLDLVDYPERVRAQQRNWIGRSAGAEVRFQTGYGEELTIHTTRPDTLYGTAYMVLSPKHPYFETWADSLRSLDGIRTYQQEAFKKSDFERIEVAKEETGAHLDGITATNPLAGKEIPIFIFDYVPMFCDTDATMTVSGHDTRDWELAKKLNPSIIEVVQGGDVRKEASTDCETSVIVNSGVLDDLAVKEAKKKIIEHLTGQGIGEQKADLRLRDWVLSRRCYWGESIPIVHCDKCGFVGLPENELPLILPEVRPYGPTDNGESPLIYTTDWVNIICPHCGVPAKRETDTTPQRAGPSWYFLRYMDLHNDKTLAGKETFEYWSPVNWYSGRMRHTMLHPLYGRFWYKFLYNIDAVPAPEPHAKCTSHGMTLGENGEKTSKSRGNVVNPDKIVEEYGADTMHLYKAFIGDFEKAAPWNVASIKGSRRFSERYYALTERPVPGDQIIPALGQPFHKTIKKVGEDIKNLKFNTVIVSLMTLINNISDVGSINREELCVSILLLSPLAPHITEGVRTQARLGTEPVAEQSWPEYDEEKCKESTVEIALQVNGKMHACIEISTEYTKEWAIQVARDQSKIVVKPSGKQIVKEIYISDELVSIAAR